jgi:hypothetical protein
MKASAVDLRYHMNEVFKALERNEEVEIFYYGEHKGTIIPKKRKRPTLPKNTHSLV